MNEILEFLKKAGTYYFGTINDEGNPDIRPIGTINLYNGKLYIQTGKRKNVYKQLMQNNHVSICAMYEGKWLRINAEVIEDNEVEAQKSMLDAYPSLQGMYQVDDGNNVVFYLKNVKASISSFTEDTIYIEF